MLWKNKAVPGVGSTGGHIGIVTAGATHGGTAGSTLEATMGGTCCTISAGTSGGARTIHLTVGGVSRTATGNVLRGGATTEDGSSLTGELGTSTWIRWVLRTWGREVFSTFLFYSISVFMGAIEVWVGVQRVLLPCGRAGFKNSEV